MYNKGRLNHEQVKMAHMPWVSPEISWNFVSFRDIYLKKIGARLSWMISGHIELSENQAQVFDKLIYQF